MPFTTRPKPQLKQKTQSGVNKTSHEISHETSHGAYLVALGILLSRISGVIRESFFAHYFGNSDAGDAFKAALKIPNFLQNLFGEGILSASFIPVYAGLLTHEDPQEAGKVAGAIASLLALVVSFLVLLGVLATPLLIDLIAPGFHDEKRQLTIQLVQIFFPGVGLLVMSAWCLGILNSHRKFFLSYAAPVVQNLAIIGALIFCGRQQGQPVLALRAAWGLVLGSALQLGVQLPTAVGLVKKLSFRWGSPLGLRLASVREVVRNFFPVVIARGVVQISAYIDNVLASWLPSGSVSALAYAQLLYLLPVSLFGMSVSAAELPAMSSAVGTAEEIQAFLRGKLDRGLRKIAFFIVPSIVAFFALGDLIVGALFQTGVFTHQNTLTVWGVLVGSTVGLLAATLGRLYSSTFYALHDTRTPLRFALVRVFLTTLLGYVFAFPLPHWLGLSPHWGTAGLTTSAGIAGWFEFLLLRHNLNQKIGKTGLPLGYSLKLWLAASTAAGFAWTLRLGIMQLSIAVHPKWAAGLILIPYGLSYFALTSALGLAEASELLRKFSRKMKTSRTL